MFNSRRYSSIYERKTNKKVFASSRLAKKEKNKIQKQTFYFLFFGIVILLLFVFLIMPGLIRLFFAFIDKDSAGNTDQDTVPPQVPVLASNPVEATFSANLNLKGFAEPKSKVIFLLNAAKSAEVEVSDEGQFEHELELADGENELSIFGVDEAGNESLKTRSYLITRDAEAPILEIEEPQDGAVIELKKNRTTTIKGKTEANAKVLINGRMVLADMEGNFSSNYYLGEGKNTLEFEAIDKATNKTQKKIEVEFKL
jgi:hypothetical protein